MADKPTYNDYPLDDVAKEAEQLIELGIKEVERTKDPNRAIKVFQKFTCGKCGARNTMGEPNTFYTSGSCQDCSHVTKITKCNTMVSGPADLVAKALFIVRSARGK